MRYFLYISIISFLGVSCASQQSFYERTPYEYENAQKNLYVVDTIKISNPLIITTKKNHRFICSEDVFKDYNGKESFFFNNQYVYIYQDELAMTIPPEIYLKHVTERFGREIQEDRKIKGIDSIYKFIGEPPIYFLFLLIQGDYYNSIYTGMHVPSGYHLGNESFSYYKVVIPLARTSNGLYE